MKIEITTNVPLPTFARLTRDGIEREYKFFPNDGPAPPYSYTGVTPDDPMWAFDPIAEEGSSQP